jgi:hypothetical protein
VSAPTDQHAGFDANANDFTQPRRPAPVAGLGSEAPGSVPHPDNPPWGVLAGVGVALGMLVLMLLVQIAATAPYLLYRVRGGMPLATAAEELPRDPTYILIAVLSIIPAHLLTLLLAWAVVTGFARRPFLKSLGWWWSPRFGRAEFFFLLGVTLAMLGVNILLTFALGDQETELTRMLASSSATRYAIAALATFSAPFVEEVVYRGVLYSALRRRLGAVASVVAVLFLFAAIHFWQYWESMAALVSITLLSLVLTVVRAWTGRLLPSVVIHLLFNGVVSLFIIFFPQAAERAPAPPPAPPTGAFLQLFDSLTRLFF